jgi:hypothetical protein
MIAVGLHFHAAGKAGHGVPVVAVVVAQHEKFPTSIAKCDCRYTPMIDFDVRSISADAICADRYYFQSLWALGDTVSQAPFGKHDRTLMLAAYRALMPPIMCEADEEAGANGVGSQKRLGRPHRGSQ